MILFKTAFKSIKKNLALSLMIFVQSAALFLTTSVMVSSVYLRMRAYYPFKDYYSSKGFCFFMGTRDRLVDKNGNIITSSKTVLEETSADSIVAAHSVTTDLYFESKDIYFEKSLVELYNESPDPEGLGGDNFITLDGISYDDEIITHYTPELSAGRWLDPNAGEIEAVIASDYSGLSIGDEVYMWLPTENDRINARVRIVGKIKDGTRIFGAPSGLESPDYRNILSVYHDDEDNPLILFSYSVLEKQQPDVFQPINHAVMAKYLDTAGTDVITEDIKAIGESTSIMGLTSTEDIEARSMRFISEQLYMLLPIIIVLIVMVLISSINASALAARNRLRDYAKFYIVGLTWRKCALVNLLQAVIINAAAILMCVAGIFIIQKTGLAKSVIVFGNSWTAAAVTVLAAFNILISMIMPLIMLSRTSPKQLLQT